MVQRPWRGRIFLGAGLILYVGPGAGAEAHAHHAVQLVWSLDGEFSVTIDGSRHERSAVLIPAHAVHELDATGCLIALLLVESHSARGVALDTAARQDPGHDITEKLALMVFPLEEQPAQDVTAWCDALLSAIGVNAEHATVSSVTRRAIDFIEHELEGVPRVSDVATRLGLSATRITHLFTAEVGMPFRRFVLWARIKRAVSEHRSGADLTTAAIAAGFSDAAHFSRTFRAMFGLSPSLVISSAEITGPIWR